MLVGMKLACIATAFCLICAASSIFAQLSDADAATQAACKKYLATPLPLEAAQISAPKRWPDCNSYKLYSGIGTKVDFAAARHCAWSERLAIEAGLGPRYTVASVFGGSAMLTVLYANGDGVNRNIPLALRFACEQGWAPAEFEGRVSHLKALLSKPAATTPKFSFCGDITSGFMGGFCAAYDSEIANARLEDRVRTLVSGFTPAQRTAFDTLRKLEEEYARAHGSGEIDLSGSARAMFEIDAQQSLREDFLAALESFEAGEFPTGSAGAFREADARLNSVYRKVMSNASTHKSEYGAVQPEGIRNAERAWLKYRDAWVGFAKLRYPAVSTDVWLALLTKDRTSILDGSFCDMDASEGECAPKGDTWKPSPLP
jgi:uncharacterized protein YecT (DUF1311 family)